MAEEGCFLWAASASFRLVIGMLCAGISFPSISANTISFGPELLLAVRKRQFMNGPIFEEKRRKEGEIRNSNLRMTSQRFINERTEISYACSLKGEKRNWDVYVDLTNYGFLLVSSSHHDSVARSPHTINHRQMIFSQAAVSFIIESKYGQHKNAGLFVALFLPFGTVFRSSKETCASHKTSRDFGNVYKTQSVDLVNSPPLAAHFIQERQTRT